MLVSNLTCLALHINDHLYYTFYNKISVTSFSQWLLEHVHRFRELIHNTLSKHAIFATEFVNGRIVT